MPIPPQQIARLAPTMRDTCRSPPRGLPRSSSLRSHLHSPSPLPSTDSVSYFPPFETMGSCPDVDRGEGSSSSPGNDLEQGHRAGRSLGSLAGIVSWGLSTLTPSSSGTSRQSSSKSSPALPTKSADGEAIEALAKRFTPGKRRVLEPAAVVNLDKEASMHKRRMKSEVEVDKLIVGMGALGGRARERDADEMLVEGLIGSTPSRPARQEGRPTLTVPLLPLPTWRYPLPSPPVVLLSPDIPLDAFLMIDNPITASTSRDTSPARKNRTINLPPSPPGDLEEIEDGLTRSTMSGTPSLSSSINSHVTTPEKSEYRPASPMFPRKLERTNSQASSDSKETIRAEGYWAREKIALGKDIETTPRLEKTFATRIPMRVTRQRTQRV